MRGFKQATLDNRPITLAELTRLAQIHARPALAKVAWISTAKGVPAVAQLKAAEILLDRAFGKANQPISGEISVVETLSLDDREKLMVMLSATIIEHEASPPGPPAFVAPERDKAP